MHLDFSAIKFGGNKNFAMKNEITLNQNMVTEGFCENEIVEIRRGDKSSYCTVSFKKDDSSLLAFLSVDLREQLGAKDLAEGGIEILKVTNVALKNIGRAKLENLNTEKIQVSKTTYEILKSKTSRLLIINNLNGYRLELNIKDIEADEIKDDTIRLGVKHRRLLDVELPTYINSYYLDKLGQEIKQYYPSEKQNVEYSDYYDTVNKIQTIYKKSNINMISIYCLNEDVEKGFLYKAKQNFTKTINGILKFLMGQNVLQLRAVRPCPLDESERIVRVTEGVIKLLGLDEADNVIVRSGKRHFKAKLMLMDSYETLANENRLKNQQEAELVIGIPAFLRSKLKLDYINTTVSVERDLGFLLEKNLHTQMLTIIGFLVSIGFVNDIIASFAGRALAFTGIIFLLLFFSFSEIRKKVTL